MTAPVGIGEVRAWAGISPTSITDAQLQQVLDAETALQAACCIFPADPWGTNPTPAALVQALYRRCARQVSARSLPLGYLNDIAEYGPVKLSSYDAEIERLEAPYRIVAIA